MPSPNIRPTQCNYTFCRSSAKPCQSSATIASRFSRYCATIVSTWQPLSQSAVATPTHSLPVNIAIPNAHVQCLLPRSTRLYSVLNQAAASIRRQNSTRRRKWNSHRILASMGASANAVWADTGTVDVKLPTDKLKASLQRPEHNSELAPVVLLNCGSFNPPTIMHLRMLDLGAQVMRKIGHPVLGSYMSPVNDAYRKPGLLSCEHRTAMCQLAAADSDLIMVDTWEAEQPSAQRSLGVLQRIQNAVQRHYRQNDSDQVIQVKTMLVTGADVLESFIKPGVWLENQVREILGAHGVVCISRNSTGLQQLLNQQGCLLNEYKHNIHVIEDPATSGISSTILRQQLRYGNTIKYLTPDSVISYIGQHDLYTD